MRIIYDPIYGHVVPDGKVSKYVDEISGRTDVVIGSELIMLELRYRHRVKKIFITDIKYKTKEGKYIKIDIDNDGKMLIEPTGFCDYSLSLLFLS